jgi:hypothetical protein
MPTMASIGKAISMRTQSTFGKAVCDSEILGRALQTTASPLVTSRLYAIASEGNEAHGVFAHTEHRHCGIDQWRSTGHRGAASDILE